MFGRTNNCPVKNGLYDEEERREEYNSYDEEERREEHDSYDEEQGREEGDSYEEEELEKEGIKTKKWKKKKMTKEEEVAKGGPGG